jgi:hypothetical protein
LAKKKSPGSKKGSSKKGGPKKAAPKKKPASKKGASPEGVAGPIEASKGESGSRSEAPPMAALPVEEPEVIVIDDDPVVLDIGDADDLDDEARRLLVAEAVAFVAQEEGSPTVADDEPDESPAVDVAAEPDAEAGAEDPTDPERPQEEAPGDEDSASAVPEEPGPLIGPQALLALSELQAEGVASLQDEFVLDLGEATTPEERDRLLAAAMAHAEMQEAIYRVPMATHRTRRIKLGIAAAIALVAFFVLIRPPALLVPDAPPGLSDADRTRGMRIALLLQAQQVEAHRIEQGRLPSSLAEVAVQIPNVRFIRSNSRSYQLVVYSADGEPMVFDSTVPAPEFERLRTEWVTTRGAR